MTAKNEKYANNRELPPIESKAELLGLLDRCKGHERLRIEIISRLSATHTGCWHDPEAVAPGGY